MSDFISTDQAVEQLMAAPEPDDAPAQAPAPVEAAAPVDPVEDATQSEAEPTAEDAPAPETASEDVTTEEPVEAAEPSIDPPHFWDAQAKAGWSNFTPEQQSVIAAQAKNGERAVTKVQQEAADARKAAEEARTKAEAEAASFGDLNKRLGEHVTDKKAEFNKRWETWLKATPDQIVAYARENPDEYTAAKAAYDAETAELQRLEAVKLDAEKKAAEAETERQSAWRTEQATKLRELAPDLSDPKEGRARWDRLIAFGGKLGVQPDQIANVDAVTLSLAYDAMRYRELLASAKTPAPKTPVVVTPQIRPAPKPAMPPKTSADAASVRLSKSGRVDDAVDLLLALQKG